TSDQPGDLAIDAAEVAGVVRIEVDAHRYAPRPARHDGIDVRQMCAIAVVVDDGEGRRHDGCIRLKSGFGSRARGTRPESKLRGTDDGVTAVAGAILH